VRFEARHIGSGRWGVYDGGVMGWRAVDLGEDEASQMAMDMDVVYNQYGQRTPDERREVRPPMEVETATWSAAGTLDYWVRERGEWWTRTRDGWTPAVDQSQRSEAYRSIGLRSRRFMITMFTHARW
jgi:hypothetical protein